MMDQDTNLPRTSVPVRVRYCECDPQQVAHHSVYPVWLEIARTELLREQGVAYRDLEARGVVMVVARMALRYFKPARYDDLITIDVQQSLAARVKIEHTYTVRREGERLATAETTLVCVDAQGRPCPLPKKWA